MFSSTRAWPEPRLVTPTVTPSRLPDIRGVPPGLNVIEDTVRPTKSLREIELPGNTSASPDCGFTCGLQLVVIVQELLTRPGFVHVRVAQRDSNIVAQNASMRS